MLFRTVTTIITSLVIALMPGAFTTVATAKSPGLSVSPVRKELTLTAGKTAQGTFEVSNSTQQSIQVNLFVRQFSLTDYNYEYQFSQPKYDWIRIDGESQRTLAPNQTIAVRYTVTVPKSTASGGYYYTLFASTDRQQTKDSMSFRLQAASLLNVTIAGKDIVKSASLSNDRVPTWITDNIIQYQYDITNTGNVHFRGESFARLEGPLTSTADEGQGPVLYPNTTRSVQGSIQAPLLPGVYRLTYGYAMDSPNKVLEHSTYVVFIPPWFTMLVITLLLFGLMRLIK